MKKIILFLTISIVGLIIFLNQDQLVFTDEINQSYENIPKQAGKENRQVESKKSQIKQDKIDKATSEEDFEEINEYLEEVETNWINGIENLFMSDAQNGENYLEVYKDMKNGYEEEREKRYQVFHKKMRDKHGSNYSYSPSVDEEMFNEKLVKLYEKSLSEKIGKEMMINYMSLKDKFNKDLESSKKSKDDFFTNIEF